MAEAWTSATCCCFERYVEYEKNRKKWLSSPGCKELEDNMTKIAELMRPVNFILCCNVGPLSSEGAYMQYAAAVQMRKILQETGHNGGNVPIVARTLSIPEQLCGGCNTILASDPFNFEQDFSNIDCQLGATSVLIAPDPDTDIARQIVEQLKEQIPGTLYGPAALLCPPITMTGDISVDEPVIQIEDTSGSELLDWAKMCEGQGRYFDSQIDIMSRKMWIYWSRPVPNYARRWFDGVKMSGFGDGAYVGEV
jgi:hypothetical protein